MSKTERLRVGILSFAILVISTLACIKIEPDVGTDPLPTPIPTEPPKEDTSSPVNVDVNLRYYEKVPTAFYHLLGTTAKQQHFETFTLVNQGQETVTVKLISEIEGFTEQAIDTREIASGETVSIDQTPIMKAGARNQLNEGQVASLHYKVTYLEDGTEKLIEEMSINVDMMSKRDLVISIVDEESNLVADFREYVVAWVTPSSPDVEALLRQAVEYMPGEAIYGYQAGEKGVLPQLAAVYQVINDVYRIRYVSTPVSLAKTDQTYVQRIRLPAETIHQKAGNCIETAALYASAIEAMDMNPLLVLVPGHAFVACETNKGSHQYIFIETTVLGEGRTFEDALAMGQKNWEKFQGQTMLIDVRHWRDKRIMPMPED